MAATTGSVYATGVVFAAFRRATLLVVGGLRRLRALGA